MIGQQLGPYTLEAELGSGGMGTVYLAKDPEGRRRAIKIVHPHLLDSPGFFKRFLREAEIGRKVEHPNVVRTLDCDAIGGHHFLVTEYVEGKSLRSLLQDLGTIPETLLREIALQTAAGLAAIHEAGIVHRDLKPENILITDDHEIRVMDLGVAKLAEATIELTREGQFAGSLLYAAPEQFRGDLEVGPASDLYALGVLLYELATGANPFRRDDHAQVIDAHLRHEPRRIRERNPETTRFLAELVACLLDKNPGKRFESAGALHHVLEQAERSTWWTMLAPCMDREPRPRIRVRRETRLHGRAHDLERLTKAWDRAKSEAGNTVWIDGEAGIGKTRLLADFLDSIEDDAHILYGSYPPSGGLGGFSDAILDRFGEVDLEDRLRPYLAVTPLLVPAFAALVRHDVPPEGAEPIQGDALNAVGVHLMRGLAAEKPTLWIVDDLHFAPRESRDLALSLSRAAEGRPVLLIYTARTGVPEEELAHFERLEIFERWNLHRLGAREVVLLLADAFRSEALAEKLAGKIAVKSDGVPFFVFEMIRGLKEGQFIEERADGSYVQTKVVDDIKVPSAVKDLVSGRLGSLTETQRSILDAGSVQGLHFDAALVATILGENEVRVLRALAEIERRHGLIRDDGNAIRFDQNQIQEVIYQDLPPQLRSRYHTLLADAHTATLAGEPGAEDCVFLASHHLRGSRPEAARSHLIAALDHLGKSFQNEASLEMSEHALSIPGLLDGKERVEVLARKAVRHGLRGEQEARKSALDEALALAETTGDAVLCSNVLVSLGWYHVQVAQYDRAKECLERALELTRKKGDKAAQGNATGNLGNVSWSQGRYEEARAHYEDWLTLARETGNRHSEVSALNNIGNALGGQGRFEEARPYYEQSLELAREIGHRQGEARATGNLGLVFYNQGRQEQTRAHFERHLALAREIGDRHQEATAWGNLGTAFYRVGRYEKALLHHEKHLGLSREIGDRLGEIRAMCGIGLVHLGQGRYEEAFERLERGAAAAQEIGDRQGEVVAAGALGHVLLYQGLHEEARSRFEQQRAVAREAIIRQMEGYALHGLGMLADAMAESENAAGRFAEALALLRELGEKGTGAETLVALGVAELRAGDFERAGAHLSEALALDSELLEPGTILQANVHAARLSGGDVQAALAALDEHEDHSYFSLRMDARYWLWKLTGDRAHLEEAKRLLDFALEHSPEQFRQSMLENVPLHRDIMKAWNDRH